MTRSMPKWRGRTDWTPPEQVVELVAAIAAGELDQWSGRFLRAGVDDLDTLRALTPEDAARQLRLRPYGDDDPLRLTERRPIRTAPRPRGRRIRQNG